VKTTALILLVFLTSFGLQAQTPPNLRPMPQRFSVPATNAVATATPDVSAVPPALPLPPAPAESVAPPPSTGPKEEMVPAGDINFQGVDVDVVLDVYARYVGRTLLRAGLPQAKIILRTETSLTRSEVIQALQGVLALNGIALISIGDKFVKAVPATQAGQEAAPFNEGTGAQLPDVGQYVTYIVQLKYVKPTEMAPILTPFAKLNSIVSIDSNGILVLRDNAENVKRMLEMIKQVDVSVPAEYISEVIPIKYALASDIESALNSLSGSGGSTVAIGGSTATTPISGMARSGSTMMGTTPGQYQPNQPRTLGTPLTGTPTSGNTFSGRLQAIINRAASGASEQIQIFGQTKIIADERSNSLLVFATRPDMERIKEVVGKLDVLLAQVLIEAVIIDVSLNKGLNFGVSVAQNQKTFSGNSTNILQNIIGAGGMNNGQSFLNFLSGSIGTNSSSFANSLPNGLSYFGNIGPTWDVALTAAASDNSATVIQRPRIQTSQAKAASFFVGQTVPYITGNSYGYGSGTSASYSQLSVGVELDVTPFINPDGLVVMDIQQEIDDLNGTTHIDNVGDIPNTIKRTLSSEIAVKNKDTIMLGGFIRSEKQKKKSGVPLLMDIPLLGNLFTSRTDTKDRSETIVLIRPTVLKTPELAAAQAVKEQERLPGISAAVAEDAAYERKQIEVQRKAELKRAEAEQKAEQKRQRSQPQSQSKFFQPVPPDSAVDTNIVTLPNP
jgi:general secretion pathway protein D